MKKNNLNDHIEKILNDGKAENIVSIPLKGKSSLADYMIIASGTSTRHVSALSNQITSKLKMMDFKIFSTQGQRNGDWVLVDAGDVIVHLFRPEERELYNLDKMWLGPNDLNIEDNLLFNSKNLEYIFKIINNYYYF